MYTLGHHNNVFLGYTRYNECREYIDRSQQCIPWVIITMCIQDTQGKMNVDSINIGRSNVSPGYTRLNEYTVSI